MSLKQREAEQQKKMQCQSRAIKCFWRRLNIERVYKITLSEAAMIWCASRMAEEFDVNFREGEMK